MFSKNGVIQSTDDVLFMIKKYSEENNIDPEILLAMFEAGQFSFKMAQVIPFDDKPLVHRYSPIA